MNAEHFLGNVRRTGDVASVGRHVEGPEVFFAFRHLDVKRRQDGRQTRLIDGRAEEPKEPRQLQFHGGIFHPWHTLELDGTLNLCAGPFLQQTDAAFGGQSDGCRINAALKAEAGVGAEGVTLGGLPHSHRVEPGGLKQHGGRAFADTAARATVDPCETHGPLVVGDHQVFRVKFSRLVIQCHERFLRRGLPNNHLPSLNLGEVKRVKRIAKLMQHQVGGVHHVVDGLHTDGAQLLLGPVWARRHRDVVQLHSQVMRTVF